MFNIDYNFKTLRSSTSFIKYNGLDEEARNIKYINSFREASATGAKATDFNFDFQGDFEDLYFEDPEYEQLLISDFIKMTSPGYNKHGKNIKF
jgi:hypothetical protein